MAAQVREGDAAGNQEQARVLTLHIDKTRPAVQVTRDPAPNASGWNNTDVVATFTATDALSGIDGEGTAQVV
ncbi:MAG: hypothetical protein HY560_07640 [Gemmatimonadetes bacterium]|nr:hypothetical protein [Gemmatimonadota bacterium]